MTLLTLCTRTPSNWGLEISGFSKISILSYRNLFWTVLLTLSKACLEPLQQNDLDATTYRLVDTKYGDGITATQIYNATLDRLRLRTFHCRIPLIVSCHTTAVFSIGLWHGRCVNEIPSICNWKFKYCGTNSMYNNTATAIFALESQYNPGNFMYANVASAVSHFYVPEENICTSSNRYMWYAFYADCTDRYYFFKPWCRK